MMIHDITAKAGKYRGKKRIGRGIGSGIGKTSGRGVKGAGSRSGWSGSIRPSREGGQMPFFRRLPKRGFSNANFRTAYLAINLYDLEGAFNAGEEVTPEALVKVGLITDLALPVKVLAKGSLKKALKVSANAFSAAAKAAIEKAGGSATTL